MEPLIALALWRAITTAALVLSSSSCPVGAIVSEELDEELSKCFYKVVCSSKSAQGVGVTRELVLPSVFPFLPAAWTMFRIRRGMGVNYLLGKLRWLK